VAWWDDPSGSGGLTTQAERLSDLERNIREAVAVHFEPGEQPGALTVLGIQGKSGKSAQANTPGAHVSQALNAESSWTFRVAFPKTATHPGSRIS
jgi:hypothetical protein